MPDPAAIALANPGVDQGIACAGTALESRSFLVRKKAFLFLSNKQLRLKLGKSVADARNRGFAVGSGGWLKLDLDDLPAQPLLKAWIAESYALFAGVGKTNSTPAKPIPRRKSGC